MRARFALSVSVAACLAGCSAFDLGPESEAALAAEAANPNYPRIADLPPLPDDVPTAEDHGEEAESLVAERDRLDRAARTIRRQRPQPAEGPTLPDDFEPLLPIDD